ncbi:MAG: Crp/Fnr family transcriptional regulator, partial [Oxalobacteraceae bacterium]
MVASLPSTFVPRNRLLAMLPPEVFSRPRLRLEPVEFDLRKVVQMPDEPVTAVYFPEDGNSAEVGIVCFEGIVDLPLLLSSDRSPTEGLIQAPGTFLRLGADAFGVELDHSAPLRTLLLRYPLAFQAQVTQTAACNGRHAMDQRMARWLLIAHDRAEGDTFPMTQEFLAMMLCVHRPGITVAARLFQ